jgi:hypothetical protein
MRPRLNPENTPSLYYISIVDRGFNDRCFMKPVDQWTEAPWTWLTALVYLFHSFFFRKIIPKSFQKMFYTQTLGFLQNSF